MQYIHVAKDPPQDHREQGVELVDLVEPVGSSASDAPALLPKRARVVGLSDAQADAISSALKRSKK